MDGSNKQIGMYYHILLFSSLPLHLCGVCAGAETPLINIRISRHTRPGAVKLLVYHGPKRQDLATALHDNDIVLTTYDTLRTDWSNHGPLYTCTWARVVLDEGWYQCHHSRRDWIFPRKWRNDLTRDFCTAHKIRNSSSKIFNAACEISARFRWCLTGTPIQNSLDDFGSLLAFIGVPPFVTRDQYRFWISSPIFLNREHSLRTLQKLVRATCLRRTKAQPYLASTLKLPRKNERFDTVELLPDERKLYEFFKRRSYLLASKDAAPGPTATTSAAGKKRRRANEKESKSGKLRRKSTGSIVLLLSVLRLICNHGQVLLPRAALEVWQKRDEEKVTWNLLHSASEDKPACCVCGTRSSEGMNEVEENGMVEFSCKKHVACETCLNLSEDARPMCPECSSPEIATPEADVQCTTKVQQPPSSKVSALLRNIVKTFDNKDFDDGTQSPAKTYV